MKKYALLLTIGLTLSGNADAVTYQEFTDYLTDVQRDYPIVSRLRNEEGFKASAKRHLRRNPKLSPGEILFYSYKENLQKYHNKMSTDKLCWDLVEHSGSLHTALKELVGFLRSGTANTTINEDFEKFLDRTQAHYPILKDLRTEENFLTSAKGLLGTSSKKTPEEVLNDCIKENISKYINSMGDNSLYFKLVEGLDPLYRDLNPNCGTNGNGRPVKGVFHQRVAQ